MLSDSKEYLQLKLKYISRFLKLLFLDFVSFDFRSKSQWRAILEWGLVIGGCFPVFWPAAIMNS